MVVGIVRWRMRQYVCHFGSNRWWKGAGDVPEPCELSRDIRKLKVEFDLQEPDVRVLSPVWWQPDGNMADLRNGVRRSR